MRIKFIPLIVLAGVSMLIAAVLLFSGPRMRFQPSVGAFEEVMPYPPENSTEFNHSAFDTALFMMPAHTKENLEKGWTYFGYYCSFCHGHDGSGNGEVGKSYIPVPANLSGERIHAYTERQLYRASFTGTGHSPVLERVIPHAHRPFIILYVRDAFKTGNN